MSKSGGELIVQTITSEVELQLQDEKTLQTLVDTTFKGLEKENIKKAMIEGMIRGFTFKDFLEKKVYAIPYKDNYSGKQVYTLVTSIDHARRIGSRSGIVGKDAPKFDEDGNGSVTACTVTVHKKIPGDSYVGDFTATVYFSEYAKLDYKTGLPKDLWKAKPRTMLAKVAEMHALRMACPEELAQTYAEEELEKDDTVAARAELDVTEYQLRLEGTGSTEELTKVWATLPGKVRAKLAAIKDELKAKYAANGI